MDKSDEVAKEVAVSSRGRGDEGEECGRSGEGSVVGSREDMIGGRPE